MATGIDSPRWLLAIESSAGGLPTSGPHSGLDSVDTTRQQALITAGVMAAVDDPTARPRQPAEVER